MPDETIRFKVQIDDSDLPQQLSNVRERVNQAMSSPFGASTATTPQFYTPDQTVQIATGIPPEAAFNTGALTLNEQMRQSYAAISSRMEDVSSSVGQGYQRLASDIGGAFAPLSQGSSRFINNPYDTGTSPFWGQFGMGYDQRSPEFRSEYMARNQQTVARDFAEGLTDATMLVGGIGVSIGAGAAAGGLATLAGLGMAAGPIGLGVSLAVGGAAMAVGSYVDLYREKDKMTEGLQAIGVARFNRFTEGQAENVSNRILDFVTSYEGRALDYSMQEVTGVITQFAAGGGFSQVNNAREFEQKTMELVSTFRTFAKTMGLFQEEAVQILAELEQKRIMPVGAAPMLAGYMTALGRQEGIAPMELIQFGMQGTEMARGTGMTPEAGFRSLIDARVETERLMKSNDPYYLNAIYNLGGPAAATQALFSGAMRFNASGLGDLALGSRFFGGGFGGSIQDQVDRFSSGVGNDPFDLFDYEARKGFVASEFGMKGSNIAMINQAISILKDMGGEVTPGRVVGMIPYLSGGAISTQEAWAIFGSVVEMSPEDKKKAERLLGGGMAAYMDAIAVDESTSGTDVVNRDVLDKAGRPIAGGIYQFTGPTLRGMGYTRGIEKFAEESVDYQNSIMLQFTQRNIARINELIAADKLPGYAPIDINNITEQAAGLMSMLHYSSEEGFISAATGGPAVGRPQVGGPPIDRYRDRFLERFRPRRTGQVPLTIPGLIELSGASQDGIFGPTKFEASAFYNTFQGVMEASDISPFDAISARIGSWFGEIGLPIGKGIQGTEKGIARSWERTWDWVADVFTGNTRYYPPDKEFRDNPDLINQILEFEGSPTYESFSEWRAKELGKLPPFPVGLGTEIQDRRAFLQDPQESLKLYKTELEKALGQQEEVTWGGSRTGLLGLGPPSERLRAKVPEELIKAFSRIESGLGEDKDALKRFQEIKENYFKSYEDPEKLPVSLEELYNRFGITEAGKRAIDATLYEFDKTKITLGDQFSFMGGVIQASVGGIEMSLAEGLDQYKVISAKLEYRARAEKQALQTAGFRGFTNEQKEYFISGMADVIESKELGGKDMLFANIMPGSVIEAEISRLQTEMTKYAEAGKVFPESERTKFQNDILLQQYRIATEFEKRELDKQFKDKPEWAGWKKYADALAKDPGTLLGEIHRTLALGTLKVEVTKPIPKD